MFQLDRKRQVALLLGVLIAVGLIVFAAFGVIRWNRGAGGSGLSRISLNQAPLIIQEAANRLQSSRVAYTIPFGDTTYIVVSTGDFGAPVEPVKAERDPQYAGNVNVSLRSSTSGARLMILALKPAVADGRNVRLTLDGNPMTALVNPDNLELRPLPDNGAMVITGPEPEARVSGGAVQVSGFARLYDGRVSVQVFAEGKGRLLGESLNVQAAAASPDWGSFRVTVPVTVPTGVTRGYVLVYDQKSGAKVAVPITFGSK